MPSLRRLSRRLSLRTRRSLSKGLKIWFFCMVVFRIVSGVVGITFGSTGVMLFVLRVFKMPICLFQMIFAVDFVDCQCKKSYITKYGHLELW
jgi:hypothetical protein